MTSEIMSTYHSSAVLEDDQNGSSSGLNDFSST